jgi:hypothetical protein
MARPNSRWIVIGAGAAFLLLLGTVGGPEFPAHICAATLLGAPFWLIAAALLHSSNAPVWRKLGTWLPIRGRWLCYLVAALCLMLAMGFSAAAVLALMLPIFLTLVRAG